MYQGLWVVFSIRGGGKMGEIGIRFTLVDNAIMWFAVFAGVFLL